MDYSSRGQRLGKYEEWWCGSRDCSLLLVSCTLPSLPSSVPSFCADGFFVIVIVNVVGSRTITAIETGWCRRDKDRPTETMRLRSFHQQLLWIAKHVRAGVRQRTSLTVGSLSRWLARLRLSVTTQKTPYVPKKGVGVGATHGILLMMIH